MPTVCIEKEKNRLKYMVIVDELPVFTVCALVIAIDHFCSFLYESMYGTVSDNITGMY